MRIQCTTHLDAVHNLPAFKGVDVPRPSSRITLDNLSTTQGTRIEESRGESSTHHARYDRSTSFHLECFMNDTGVFNKKQLEIVHFCSLRSLYIYLAPVGCVHPCSSFYFFSNSGFGVNKDIHVLTPLQLETRFGGQDYYFR